VSDDKQQQPGAGPGKDAATDKQGQSQDPSKDKSEASTEKAGKDRDAKKQGAKEATDKTQTAKSGEAKKGAAADKPKSSKPRRSRLWIFLILFLLIAAGAAGGGAWYLWQRLQRQEQSFNQNLSALANRLEQAQSDRRAATSKLEHQLESLREQQQATQNAIEVLRAKSGRSEAEWRVAEATYLIRIANDRLVLERDVGTALAALRAADKRLRLAGDPALLPVRKQLANEIQALRSVDQPDVPGLSLALGGLIDEADKLPLNSPHPAEAVEQPASGAAAAKGSGWRDALKGVWEELKGLVVVRHPEHPAEPLLPPSQRFFLTQNLRLQLEQARLALLQGDAADYRQRIATAQGWIRTYFDQEAAATRGALDTLAHLAKQDVHPKLPDISGSLRSLKQYRAKLHQGSGQGAGANAKSANAAAPTGGDAAGTPDASTKSAPNQDQAR